MSMGTSWDNSPSSSNSTIVSITPTAKDDSHVNVFHVAIALVAFVLLALVGVVCTKLAHRSKHKDDLNESKEPEKPKVEPDKPKKPEVIQVCICNSMVPVACGSSYCNYCATYSTCHGCYCGNYR